MSKFIEHVITFLVIFASLLWKGQRDESNFHEEAVKVGHAEYYLDAHNERRWRWKPEPVTNPEN